MNASNASSTDASSTDASSTGVTSTATNAGAAPAPAAVHAVPPGMHSLTPHLVCANAAAAIAFYRQAFGAEEIMRMAMPDGKIAHAMLRIDDSMLMLADEFPQWQSYAPTTLKGSPVTIHLALADVDARFARALAAGATVRMAPADMFWGDRYGVLVDPFGHHWALATHVRDVPADEMQAAMLRMCEGEGGTAAAD